jgi:SCL-interrupting locus protein
MSSYCTSNCINIDSLSNFISIFSTIYYKNQANTISADLNFDTISLSNRFIAQPAQTMPILTTALSKALQSAINFYSAPKTGYCTIYQNSKILLVLESDPKANTLPLIGM